MTPYLFINHWIMSLLVYVYLWRGRRLAPAPGAPCVPGHGRRVAPGHAGSHVICVAAPELQAWTRHRHGLIIMRADDSTRKPAKR